MDDFSIILSFPAVKHLLCTHECHKKTAQLSGSVKSADRIFVLGSIL